MTAAPEPSRWPVQLVTRDQLAGIVQAWMGYGFMADYEPPKKGQTTIIAWPIVRRIVGEPTAAKITVHDQKSTYGKTLYRIEFSA